MLISPNKFANYQAIFLGTLMASPYSVNMWVETTDATDLSDFDDFVGDKDRVEPVKFSFRCLYDKMVSAQKREKYGVQETVNGVIFMDPTRLKTAFGTFKLDIKKTKVQFEDRIQVINKITYLEGIYGSVVSVRLDLEDDLKGGS